MPITIEVPRDVDIIEYLVGFAPAFAEDEDMRAALLGVGDSLRQAALILPEPLGLFACITAEEEAATFLYNALVAKGYGVPRYGKLYSHVEKIKYVVLAKVLHDYFFSRVPAELAGVVVVERDGVRPKTSRRVAIGDFFMVEENPLEAIATIGDGETGHDKAVEAVVNEVLDDLVPNGFTLKSYIKKLSNKRNRCIYGDPLKKLRLSSEDGIEHFKSNCVSIIVLGFMISNSKGRTVSMEKLIAYISGKIFL